MRRNDTVVAGNTVQDSSDHCSMTLDSDLCLAPVICESPALALAHRSRAQFPPGLPHDSATSLVRLDMRLLPSPLSQGVVFAKACKAGEGHHGSTVPCDSHDTPMCTPAHLDGHAADVARNANPQNSLATHAVPMIISPDEHHDMQSQVKHCEEEFILYSAPLIDSPGSDSLAESPGPVSPESPADRSILPNSAPGFIISPSPVPFLGAMHDHFDSTARHTASSVGILRASDTPVQNNATDADEVDDVDALNLLLK